MYYVTRDNNQHTYEVAEGAKEKKKENMFIAQLSFKSKNFNIAIKFLQLTVRKQKTAI